MRTLRHQGQLWSKALHMVGFLLEEGEGDELREVSILHPQLLEPRVQV